jgi:hypothetical protein
MAVEAMKKIERPRRAWHAISRRTTLAQNNHSLLYPKNMEKIPLNRSYILVYFL